MKLTDRMHMRGCEPLLHCDCMALGELILEVSEAIVLAQRGIFAPWETKDEAVKGLRVELDRLNGLWINR